jgi:hypothetical protein
MAVIVISPCKTPKKVIKNTALAHGQFGPIAGKKSGFDGILHHSQCMKCAPLHAFSTLQVRLDDLLLNTTYCDEKYTLPTQAEAIRATIEVAEKEWELSKRLGQRTLFLFGAYTIGKEKIYLSVVEQLQLNRTSDKPFSKKMYDRVSAFGQRAGVCQQIATVL